MIDWGHVALELAKLLLWILLAPLWMPMALGAALAISTMVEDLDGLRPW